MPPDTKKEYRRDWYSKILDDFNRERNTRAFYQTRGYRKLLNFALEITKWNSFQELIAIMRKEFQIPELGYNPDGPSWTHPPKEWPHYENKRVIMGQIQEKIKIFCKKYHLFPGDWVYSFECYLFYNKLLISYEPNSHNLCYVSDLVEQKDSLGHLVTKDEYEAFPIALQISPYASERDILDYLKKVYRSEILPIQNKYRQVDAGIGKYKTKKGSIQKRNQFIFQNRYLPRKRLMRLVADKFPGTTLDYSEIGKIISLEIKRRKKV